MAAICGYFLSLSGGYEKNALAAPVDGHWRCPYGPGSLYSERVRKSAKCCSVRKGLLSAFCPECISDDGGRALRRFIDPRLRLPDSVHAATLRTIAGLPPRQKPVEAKPITNINEAVVYRDIIHPIFDARCVSCHNPEKEKRRLPDGCARPVAQGGEHGKSLVPGNATQSDIVKRLLLPEADEDHMPPKGKTQLTKEEVELVKWWINSGASFDKTVAQLQATPDVKVMLTKLGSGEEGDKPKGILATKVPAADTGLVNKMRRMGILVMPVAQGSNFLQARWQPRAKDAGNQPFALLPKMTRQVTWLDWSGLELRLKPGTHCLP